MSRRLVIGKLDWYHFEKQVLPTSVWSLGWTEVCFWVRSIACAWVWREMSLFGILRDLDWSFRSIDLHIWWHSFICIPILPMLVQYGPCYRCSLTIRLQQVQESRCTNASLACCCRVMQCIDYMFALVAQECCFFDRPGSISQAHHWIVVDDRSGVLIEVSTEDNLRFDWWCSLTLIGSGNVMYHDMRWMGQRSSAHGVSFCVHSIGESFFSKRDVTRMNGFAGCFGCSSGMSMFPCECMTFSRNCHMSQAPSEVYPQHFTTIYRGTRKQTLSMHRIPLKASANFVLLRLKNWVSSGRRIVRLKNLVGSMKKQDGKTCVIKPLQKDYIWHSGGEKD